MIICPQSSRLLLSYYLLLILYQRISIQVNIMVANIFETRSLFLIVIPE
jgi:hypothetical protein